MRALGVRYVFGVPSGGWVDYMEALRAADAALARATGAEARLADAEVRLAECREAQELGKQYAAELQSARSALAAKVVALEAKENELSDLRSSHALEAHQRQVKQRNLAGEVHGRHRAAAEGADDLELPAEIRDVAQGCPPLLLR